MDRDSLTRLLVELWGQRRYMEALTTAWQAPPVYSYHLIIPRGSEITLRELLFRSCRQALLLAAQGNAAHAEAQAWVETLLNQFPPPLVLIDHGDGEDAETYRERVIRAHLECVRAALEQHGSPETIPLAALTRIASVTRFPVGFLRDLVHVLLSADEAHPGTPPSKTVNLTALLVGGARGIAAALKLDLIEQGTGDLYPAPELAFIRRDAEFLKAEESVRVWSGLSSQLRDVRWSLRRFDGQGISALTGPSMGLAFSLGIAKLLSTLKDIEDVDLESIGATAVLTHDGSLQKIGGLWKKLGEQTLDLMRRGLLQAVVVAAEQDDVPSSYIREDAESLRVITAGHIADAIRQLSTRFSPRRAVCQYEQEQCRHLEILGRTAPIEKHYQAIPLLREIRREHLLRSKPRVPSQSEERNFTEESLKRLQDIDIRHWEETLQEEQIVYETVSLDQVFRDTRGSGEMSKNTVPRFVILGPPGSGKTTLEQYLAWQAANGSLRLQDRSLVPARVRLQDWEKWMSQARDSEHTLSDYLTRHYGDIPQPPTSVQWRRWLHRGDVLLLLDGLDEIEGKPAFLSALRAAFSLFSACPIVITCRTVSFELYRAICPDFAVFTLSGLTDAQREAYIHAFPHNARERDSTSALIEQLRSAPQLRLLTATPLLLSVMCSVTAQSRNLTVPHTRAALYQKMLEGLLRSRAHRIDIQYPGAALDVTDKLTILQYAAFYLFTTNDQQHIYSAEELQRAFLVALERGRYQQGAPALWASALRRDFIENSGILRGSTEQGFFFLHPTVKEFLVAATLARFINAQGWETKVEVAEREVSLRDLINHKAWDPRWHEVIIFLAGQLTDPLPLFTLLTRAKQDDIFRHRLALAAMCLPEALGVERPQLTALTDQITTETVTYWLQYEQQGKKNAVPHLTRTLPLLGAIDGHVKTIPLWKWLCQQLQERDKNIRASVVEAVGHLGEGVAQHPEVLSTLAISLNDEDALIRLRAITAFRRIGIAAAAHPNVMPALIQTATHDEERFIRLSAQRALEQIGGAETVPSETPPGLAEPFAVVSQRSDSSVTASPRQNTDTNLSLPMSLSDAITTLRDAESGVRASAVEVITHGGDAITQHPHLLPLLCEVALHDTDGGVRMRTIEALGQIGIHAPQFDKMMFTLIAALRDRDENVRTYAARAFAQIGERSVSRAEALSALLEALRDGDSTVRFEAADALGRLMSRGVRIFQSWWGKVEGKRVTDLANLAG